MTSPKNDSTETTTRRALESGILLLLEWRYSFLEGSLQSPINTNAVVTGATTATKFGLANRGEIEQRSKRSASNLV